MERNELCWCGSGKKYKKCHMPIEEQMRIHADRGEIVPTRSLLKTPHQIETRRQKIRWPRLFDCVFDYCGVGIDCVWADFVVGLFHVPRCEENIERI